MLLVMAKTKAKKPTRGRPPVAGKTFDDRTMIRMFKTEHAAWKAAAAKMSAELGIKVSVGTFIRLATNQRAGIQ